LEEEIREETTKYKEKYLEFIKKQEEDLKAYKEKVNEEIIKKMFYESTDYAKATKEFEQVMRMSDFDSAKKLSQEIEKLKLEDIAILNKRKKDKLRDLLHCFKEKQKKELNFFKTSSETQLIELQTKWQSKLDTEKKKMN